MKAFFTLDFSISVSCDSTYLTSFASYVEQLGHRNHSESPCRSASSLEKGKVTRGKYLNLQNLFNIYFSFHVESLFLYLFAGVHFLFASTVIK